ncbi:glutamate receptor 3.3-like [Amaranthus tricolor]|uniref:glutamate receptor 3.3-like n=1 Tax=Amaranthus tricolor TaxID=29722 RepID=UPI0025848997|nr:glutamate receptor 3.3-like [Amaranthus tricolor]XP_057516994.1 glutamate receptor 3.3-like [Amaranthus tricolor]
MKVNWLHVLITSFLFVLLDGADNNVSRPSIINIGALFSFNSTIGKVANIAIQKAIDDVNSNSSIVHGSTLNLTMRDFDCSGFSGFIQAMQLMETQVVAIIGPQSSTVSHMVSLLASELQIPLLSFSATDPTLTPSSSPFFVRTIFSDQYQMTAISEIVDFYGWREVVVVYINDDYGRNGIAAFNDALADKRGKISYKAAIPPDTSVTRSDIMDIFAKIAMLESRVIILHVNPQSGRLIFDVASYLGMTGSGYAWICTDWLASLIDSSSPLPSGIMNSMQGFLVLRPHTPDSSRKRDFVSRWKKEARNSLGLSAYALYAYDSVWMLAHAIDAFLNNGGNISFSSDSKLRELNSTELHLQQMRVFDGGRALLSNILHSDLIGLTGPLKFESDRSLAHPAYDIINVVGTGYRQIGYWSNYSGLSTASPETLYSKPSDRSSANQHLYPVFWPDGSTIVPRGWIFPNTGVQLKIGVPVRHSFKEFVSRVPGRNDMFKGFCVDVFQAAVNLLQYPVPYEFVAFGDGHKNPNYTDLVNGISTGIFDAVVGDVTITTSRTKIVDFTQPFVSSGLVVVVPFKKLNSGAWAFLRPFSPLMWAVIVLSFITVGAVVWILEHRVNDEFRGSRTRQFITILWFSFSTLTFSHKENTLSCLGRMVVIIWLFVVLILTSSYTASLTSILTVQQLSSPIKGIDSLIVGETRIGYQVGSFAEKYLSTELNISQSRLVELKTPEEYADALRSGRIHALVDELPYVELFLASHCDFRIVGPEFTRNGWGFAFPRDSPLAPDMSTAILKLSENGDLQRIHDKWLTMSSCSQDNTEIESSQLHLGSFLGLFLISGVACIIALCLYFTRICYRCHMTFRTETTSNIDGSTSSLKRIRTLITLIDEKKDPSKKRKKTREIGDSSFDDDRDEECGTSGKRKQYQVSGDENTD